MKPIIGLFGSMAGDWREQVKVPILAANLHFYNPTDTSWQGINSENGDQKQPEIDHLVALQHQGMHRSTCVLYQLDAFDPDTNEPITAFAARCELGFLTGAKIPTFVHINKDVEGRNYLWAQIKPYPHMQSFASLKQALDAAIAFAKTQT